MAVMVCCSNSWQNKVLKLILEPVLCPTDLYYILIRVMFPLLSNMVMFKHAGTHGMILPMAITEEGHWSMRYEQGGAQGHSQVCKYLSRELSSL